MQSGVPLLFLPGLNCTGRLFALQRAALRNHPMLTANHGDCDAVESDVARILQRAPPQFVAIGLSMGGYLALEIAKQAPERLLGLVLIDTRARGDTDEEKDRRQRMLKLVADGHFEALHGILWPKLVHPDRQNDLRLETIVLGMMRRTGAQRFMRQQTAVLNRRDYLPNLKSIRVPTLVMTGAQDAITPPEMARELAAGIPGAECAIIPQCGHLSTLEAPAAVNKAIKAFLAKHFSRIG